MNTHTPTETITGPRQVSVKFEDGHEETFSVRQIRVRNRPLAFKAWLAHNEAQVIALAVEKLIADIENLTPESYDKLYTEVEQVNANFFTYCGRQVFVDQMILKIEKTTIPTPMPSPTLPPPRG